jgi:sporulation protein YqfC
VVINVKNKDDIITYTGEPRLELVGSGECVIDGLKGIIEYSDEKIKINLGKYYVTFFGDGLYINSFSYEGAIVQGTIVSLEFEGNG